MLDERIAGALKKVRQDIDAQGKLPSRAQLAAWYDTFRGRFGPERLRSLDGPELLSVMHDHGRRDSLVYWVEFKDDEEFPANFGSIAGGSALKFGIYKRRETGAWMTGSPQAQRELSLEEAVQMARRNRDQLLRGAALLEELPADGTDADYLRLQARLEAQAPDVSGSAWGHKYLSLLFPEKLDDFHSEDWQRFHLLKLLLVPPAEPGRYVAAGRFVAIARELGWPMNNLTRVLKERSGSPHRYWRVGTSDGTEPANRWPLMRDNACVAIGWPELGELSDISRDRESKERIRALMSRHYAGTPQHVGRATQQVFNFVTVAEARDLVLAAQGQRLLGIGRVTGGYAFVPGSDFPHRRSVEWLSLEEFELPHASEGLRTTFFEFDDAENLAEIERRLVGAQRPFIPPVVSPPAPGSSATVGPRSHPVPNLPGVSGRIQAILERKGQVILYGPPGTGKTFLAERTVRDLAAHGAFGKPFAALAPEQAAAVVQGSEEVGPLVRMCCFHPAYGYEEFIEGYRPRGDGGQMRFELRDGIFKQLCRDARRQPHQRFFLIIDEINRGDIPRIMGELLTLLEKSKRGRSVLLLPLSGEPFLVPENVHLVGTMNTADRSIALLDTALRRRFGFVELMPDYDQLGTAKAGDIPLGPWLRTLNTRILQHAGRDGRNLQVGHAYLMERDRPISDFQHFARILQDELIPLLEEYCYEDWGALTKILGSGLVDGERRCVRHTLFEPGHKQELLQALHTAFQDIFFSGPAVASEANESGEPEDAEDAPSAGDNQAA